MHTLILSKRHYTGHDLHLDAYGRVRAFSAALARAGHQVFGASVNYRAARGIHDFEWSGTCWKDRAFPGWLATFLRNRNPSTASAPPDVVVSASDALQVVLGDRLAHRWGCPHVVELYDDFEGFGLTRRVPGLQAGYRTALQRAAGICCVSGELEKKIRGIAPGVPTLAVGNGVDLASFKPADRTASRDTLALPANIPLVGIPGGLNELHGIKSLFTLIDQVADGLPADSTLVIAGNRDPGLHLPGKVNLIDLGTLPNREMPTFYNAMDLVLLPNKPGLFGDACYPMKLGEALACHTPLLAARTRSVEDILRGQDAFLFSFDSPPEFASKLADLLQHPRMPEHAPELSWEALGGAFASFVSLHATDGTGTR